MKQNSIDTSLRRSDIRIVPPLLRPVPGSKSEQRSQLAQAHVTMEMRYLCDMIWDCAEYRCPDGRAAITFGRLFKVIKKCLSYTFLMLFFVQFFYILDLSF